MMMQIASYNSALCLNSLLAGLLASVSYGVHMHSVQCIKAILLYMSLSMSFNVLYTSGT